MTIAAAFLAATFLIVSPALACSSSLPVDLETFGNGVSIELRRGAPGRSTVVQTRASSGGAVHFPGLCGGSYFMAIGGGETVNVTPVRQFGDADTRRSRLRVVPSSGNARGAHRKSL